MRLRFLHSIFSRYILLCRDVKYYPVYYRRGHVLKTFRPELCCRRRVHRVPRNSHVRRAPPSNISGLGPRPFARGRNGSVRSPWKYYIDFKKKKRGLDTTWLSEESITDGRDRISSTKRSTNNGFEQRRR